MAEHEDEDVVLRLLLLERTVDFLISALAAEQQLRVDYKAERDKIQRELL